MNKIQKKNWESFPFSKNEIGEKFFLARGFFFPFRPQKTKWGKEKKKLEEGLGGPFSKGPQKKKYWGGG